MKKLLIINNSEKLALYENSHLLSLLSKSYSISLICSTDTVQETKSFTLFEDIKCIDKLELKTLLDNQLFCSAFALEKFYNTLKDFKIQTWDLVINFDYDQFSSLIGSYFLSSTLDYEGFFWNKEVKKTCLKRSEYLANNFLFDNLNSPINNLEIISNEIGISLDHVNQSILSSSTERDHLIINHYNSLKEHLSPDVFNSKVVGFYFDKNWPWQEVQENIKLLTHAQTLPNIVCVTICDDAKTAHWLKNLSSDSNKDLLIIESSPRTLPSIIKNLDLIICAQSKTSHFISLANKNCLVLASNISKILKNGQYSHGTHFLSSNSSQPNLFDLSSAILFLLSESKMVKPLLSNDSILYSSKIDDIGLHPQLVAGDENQAVTIHRIISRALIGKIHYGTEFEVNSLNLKNINVKELRNYLASQNEFITSVLKELFGAIRNLSTSSKSGNAFIENLSSLYELSSHDSCITFLLTNFKFEIENLPQSSKQENVESLRALFYNFKESIQKCSSTLLEIDQKYNVNRIIKHTPSNTVEL